MLRLPDGMRDRIASEAKANNRSMNAEIVAALEERYPVKDPVEEIRKILQSMSKDDQKAAIAFVRSFAKY